MRKGGIHTNITQQELFIFDGSLECFNEGKTLVCYDKELMDKITSEVNDNMNHKFVSIADVYIALGCDRPTDYYRNHFGWFNGQFGYLYEITNVGTEINKIELKVVC